jgi:MazG family protein
MTSSRNSEYIDQLIEIMENLRDPESGCPWDLEQNFETIAPHTIEEAYEVAEAIARNDMQELKDELGDLMFQVVFYAQMAKEAGHFDFNDVVQAISEKMIRRHPHVFGTADIATAEAQTIAWEEVKARERAMKSASYRDAAPHPPSALDGVAETLPALTRAVKLQKRAARVGFDWPSITPVLDKIREELGELQAEIDTQGSETRIAEEYGDLLFVMANLATSTLNPKPCCGQPTESSSVVFRLLNKPFQKKEKHPRIAILRKWMKSGIKSGFRIKNTYKSYIY